MRCSTPRTRREPVSICMCASSRKPSSSAAAPGRSAALVFSLRSCVCGFLDRVRESAPARPRPVLVDRVFRDGDGARSRSHAPGRWRCRAETPSPSKTRSARVLRLRGRLRFFVTLHRSGARPARPAAASASALGGALGAQLDLRAGAGGQHHQPHDRGAGDGHVALLHASPAAVEGAGQLDELRRRARVQAALVADRDPAGERV